jgi:hypothetical protein
MWLVIVNLMIWASRVILSCGLMVDRGLSTFMEAKVGFQPSYAWSSLMSAKVVTEVGARWEIGDGRLVHIFKNRWIPSSNGFILNGPGGGVSAKAIIAELIDRDTNQWDRGLIFGSFTTTQPGKSYKHPFIC